MAHPCLYGSQALQHGGWQVLARVVRRCLDVAAGCRHLWKRSGRCALACLRERIRAAFRSGGWISAAG